MKKLIATLASAGALLLPALAGAATYSGNTAFDEYDFSLNSLTGLSDVSIQATWEDLTLKGGGLPMTAVNGTLAWLLSGPGSATQFGALLDGHAPVGVQNLSFTGLANGSYKLVFTGVWGNVTDGPGRTLAPGSVNLLDGDAGERNSFKVVTAVPEPETYAMLLAGLMVMGSIARRRSSRR